MIKFKKSFFFVCAILALGGCSTGALLQSNEPKQTIYSLRPVPPMGGETNKMAKIIEIQEPSVPPGMDRDQIALLTDNGQKLDYYAASRWSATLEDVLQDFTRRSAGAVLPYVVAVTPDQAIDPDYKLQIKINEFQPVYEGGPMSAPVLKVSLEFTLIRFADDTVMGSFVLSKQDVAPDNRLDAIVAGLEGLLQDVEREAFAKIDRKISPQ